MFKLNLHDTLREYNEVQPILKNEELLLNEAQNIIDKANKKDISILAELGMDGNIKKAKQIEEINEQTKEFEEVYDISVIKKLAINYRLRFLKSDMYTGTIDPILPTKIVAFKEKHKETFGYWSKGFYILAPAKSFRLEKRPVDPIMFYKINDEKYAFVHKWGSDFSIFRWLLMYPLRSGFHMAGVLFFLSMMTIYFSDITHDVFFYTFFPFVGLILSLFIGFFPWNGMSNEIWDSSYSD